MPATQISDKDKIRNLLNSDRKWAAYALGDLDPIFFPNCQWFICGKSIALLFKGFDAPLLFMSGETLEIRELLDELRAESKLYLSVRQNAMDLLRERFEIEDEELMLRMTLEKDCDLSIAKHCVRLSGLDVPQIRQLFSDGNDRGEAPQFFEPYMVESGVFFGIFSAAELIAVAGTHLVAVDEDVAAIGCVYTKADARGRGLSTEVTAAVVAELSNLGIGTVALNVKRSNLAAIKVYERLGFERQYEFFEGTALRKGRTLR